MQSPVESEREGGERERARKLASSMSILANRGALGCGEGGGEEV